MNILFQFVVFVIVFATTFALQTTQGKRQASDKETESSGDYQSPSHGFLRFSPKHGQPLRYQQTVAYVPQDALKYSQSQGPSQLSYGHPQLLELAAQQGQHSAQPSSGPRYVTAGKDASATSPITFSPASEVSSFRFSSPLVSYSNLGVLRQVLGKTAETEVDASQTEQSSPLQPQKSAPSQQNYFAAAPQPSYAALAQPQKASAPKYAYVLPQKVAYAPAPQQYVYSNELQQQAYAAAPQQKLVYAVQPQFVSQKSAYSATPPRYVSGLPQQIPYNGPQEGAQQYTLSFAPQTAQHSVPQRVYAYPQYQFAEQPGTKSEKDDSSSDAYSQ